MADTTFVPGTVIASTWLNDVNDTVYDLLGDGTLAPVTKADVRTNIGLGNVDNTSDANKPVSTAQAAAIAAVPIPPTGLVSHFMLAAAPAGWVAADGNTIGSVASGSTRANSDTQALFNALWAMPAAIAPVLTSAGGASTRGASAAADWAADKRMTVPDLRNDFIRGSSATNVLGVRQTDTFKDHNHNTALSGYQEGLRADIPAGGAIVVFSGTTVPMQTSTARTPNNGGLETRPRNVPLLACVKL